jgi:hypothetical protein
MKAPGRTLCLVAALVGLLPAARSVEPAPQRAERERIGAARAEAEARFEQRESACRARFAVNACLEEARRERRASLMHLRQLEVVLDEAERRRRAAQRRQDIDAKTAERDRDDAAAREHRRAAARAASVARAASAAQAAGAAYSATAAAR